MYLIRTNVVSILSLIILCWSYAESSFGQKRPVRVSITSDTEDGITEVNNDVTVTATVENNATDDITGTIEWKVRSVSVEPPSSEKQPLSVQRNQHVVSTYTFSMPCSGFADIECELKTSLSEKPIRVKHRLGADVEEILSPLTREKDFFAFWKESLSQLAGVSPAFQMTLQPAKPDSNVRLYEVSMQSFGDVCVRGWLEIPKQDGVFPAILRVPGYGQNMKPVGGQENLIIFSFNPRGHGNSQDNIPGKPHDFWIRGLDSKDSYFYRGAYLDCIRALDFLCSRKDVDQNRIAVWGGSQGGGFAFATASLDQRVDLCIADIPFLCDWVNYFKLTHWEEMDTWIAAKPHRSWSDTLRTMSYFDTMNLCERVTCPTIMSIGLQDQICPPTTSFSAFNRIRGEEKTYKIYPARGHGLGKEHQEHIWQQIKKRFQAVQ